MAEAARRADDADVLQLGGEVIHPALGLLVLTVITVLNVASRVDSPPTAPGSKPNSGPNPWAVGTTPAPS